MILIVDRDNQLCNRLFVAGHLIATAIETGHVFVNLGLAEYAPLFPATANDLFCRFPLTKTGKKAVSFETRERIRRPIMKIVNALENGTLQKQAEHFIAIARSGHDSTENKTLEQVKDLIVNLDDPPYSELLRSKRIVVVRGPLARAESYFRKHQDVVRDYFQPSERCEQQVQRILSGARKMADIVIGVHMRRKDYAGFVSGRYYFSMQQYRAYTRRLASQFPGMRVAFFLCSDSDEYRQAFRSSEYLHGTGKIDEDLYALAGCDYIVGPPSTFSGWASFYGKTPLHHIRDIDETPELSSFQYLVG